MADDRVIPTATLSPKDPSGQAPPATLTNAAQSSASQQVLTAARDSVIPITYGGPDRVAGKLYICRTYQGALLVCVLLAEGPIQGVQNPALNDAPLAITNPPVANGVGGMRALYYGTNTTDASGNPIVQGFPAGAQIAITTYLGTATQGVDPTLAAAIPGFAEAMIGTAYAVIVVPPGATTGFPRLTFELLGRLVYDPRDVTQNVADASTWKWSDNPALVLADFLSSQAFGAAKSVDWTSVTAAANYCDQLVTGAGGTEKRALVSITLAEKRNVREWIEVLRAYVPAWVDYAGGVAAVIADQPRASDFTFTMDTVDQEPKPQLRKRGRSNLPTVVRVGFMRTDVTPWAMDYAEATTGSTVRRITKIDMPGIRRYSQAKRFATERLNHYTLEAAEGTFGIFEDGLKVMLGDRATITDDLIGGTLETRVIGREDRGHGRWTIAVRKYDPAAYSSSVELAPSSPDTGRPDPSRIAPPTALLITETVYLERVNGSPLAGGLIYQSRFDATWTAPVHAYPFVYRVELWDGTPGAAGSVKLRDEIVTTNAYSTPAVQQGKTYTLQVFTRNAFFESTPLAGSKMAQGKLLPPQPVPALRGREFGGVVFLDWDPAVDIDVVRYEIRYFPNGTGSWLTATFYDRPDTLSARVQGIPVGTHRFYVRAIDSVGNYSTGDAVVDVAVSSDPNSFINSRIFTNPATGQNLIAYPPAEGVNVQRWITSIAGDQWGTVMPSPLNSGANPVASYHSGGTSKFQGEWWDLGATVSGIWSLVSSVSDITGAATYALETSPDGVTVSAQPGTSFQGATRFIRPAISTTGTMLVNAPPKIQVSALMKTEQSVVTTSATAGVLVQLANQYAQLGDLQVTPINTSAARLAVADRVLLSPQTGLCLYADVTAAGSTLVESFTAPQYTLVAGDCLEYDVYIDPTSPAVSSFADGGLQLVFTDTTGINTATDADGYNAIDPAVGFDALARGVWKSRKILLTAFAGKQTAATLAVRPRLRSDSVGTHKVVLRNIRLTNGAGTVRQSLWTSGDVASTIQAQTNITNVHFGPSNSFLLYCFTDAGAQVAQDVRYSFKGF